VTAFPASKQETGEQRTKDKTKQGLSDFKTTARVGIQKVDRT
jgi:hypothetical protein